LKIISTAKNNYKDFIPFSQTLKVKFDGLKKIALSVFIKTDSISQNAGLWCQLWGKNGQIGFENLEMQYIKINGTNDWKKYSLILLVDTSVKTLVFGGYLQGNGTVWYDDFEIKNLFYRNEKPSFRIKYFRNKMVSTIKKNSIYSDSLDWIKIKKDLTELSRGLKNDSYLLVNYMKSQLRAIGDNHSFFANDKQLKKLQECADCTKPYAKLIDSNTAYLSVPGFIAKNKSSQLEFATLIQHLIKSLDSNYNIKYWIIDLRENWGGDMYPMIAGLAPIIGEGTYGYFVMPKKEREEWYYKKGKCGEEKKQYFEIKHPYTLRNDSIKIAVLIGGNTASSGEAAAVSFIGKKNVKTFGNKSAGYTTGNEGYKLPNDWWIALATCWFSDRNGKLYLHNIEPDVILEKGITDERVFSTVQKWFNDKD
jgi:C-terminal processing protease CtpA/Prc